MRIAIIGSGALGSLFAARLSLVAEVTMVGTWAAQLAAIEAGGLTLLAPEGPLRAPLRVVRDPAKASPADVALILVKSYQTERAARFAATALAGEGFALTLQNGLGNREIVAATLGSERALSGTTSEGATVVRPGVVRHAGRGLTYVARPEGDQEQVGALATLFEEAGFVTRLVADVERLLWDKLAINAAINPLTALLEVPNGFLIENDRARSVMEQAALEVAAVARALGITLADDESVRRARAVVLATAGNRSSMLQDVESGRPTELEAITGAVVSRAEGAGVAVPVNTALLRLLRLKLAGAAWQAEIPTLPAAERALVASLIQKDAGEAT